MNSRLILLSLFTALCLPAMGQIAQPLGNHYTPGIEGLEGGSLPPPGFYTRNYFYSYQADRVTNGQGAREPIGFQTMVFAVAPRLLYITPYKILGADYGCSIVLPFVYDHTKISAFDLDQSRVGLADIYVEPLDLSWHLPQADFLVTAGVYTPTGTFSTSNESSLGSGFWTQMTTAGATFYADKERAWHLSLLDRLEFSSRQEQTGLTPGNGELVEWGLGHSVDFTKEASAPPDTSRGNTHPRPATTIRSTITKSKRSRSAARQAGSCRPRDGYSACAANTISSPAITRREIR